jgi:copper chaperone CopZ/YHS domain-containing protein
MKTMVAGLVLLLAAPVGAAFAKEAYFKIEGMKSESCAEDIATALKKVDGVSQVEVNQKFGGAWVEYSDKGMSETRLAAMISSAGYPATPITAEKAKAIIEKVTKAEQVTKGGGQKAGSDGLGDGVLPPWEPVHATFRGCEGSCGSRGENTLARVQPGAKLGQLVYCPVSGVVFEVKESTPRAEVNGKPFYFCCEGCRRHFGVERDDVLRKRQLSAAKQ